MDRTNAGNRAVVGLQQPAVRGLEPWEGPDMTVTEATATQTLVLPEILTAGIVRDALQTL